MQLALEPEPDIRDAGDADCLQARLRMLGGAGADPILAGKRLRKETADMIDGGWRYWLCRDTRMASRLGGNAPEALIVQGIPDTVAPMVAVVGPRRPDGYGMEMASFFAGSFGRAGITVVSGGAEGIDTIAHLATIKSGGRTVCVVGNGFKQPFPVSNTDLFDSLGRPGRIEDACMISEYSPSKRALPQHFLQRNRIVAALADAVLVVQADFGSGAIVTARLALRMGIPVFAIPADIHYRSSAATNDLLGRGARPACRPGDLMAIPEFAGTNLSRFNRKPVRRTSGISSPWALSHGSVGKGSDANTPEAEDIRNAVLSIVSETGRAADQDSICRRTGLEVARVQAALLELELAGTVERLPGALFIVRA